MPLSRREIHTRATRFAKQWADAHNEEADAKPFWVEFFNVFAFRRYEDASLRYTGIESHEGLTHYGLYDTVVAKE